MARICSSFCSMQPSALPSTEVRLHSVVREALPSTASTSSLSAAGFSPSAKESSLLPPPASVKERVTPICSLLPLRMSPQMREEVRSADARDLGLDVDSSGPPSSDLMSSCCMCCTMFFKSDISLLLPGAQSPS
eukprot:CAMPEP_0204544354 /NCGR_PEP_ID=MMETSP0661-20131031/20482_1 /ASSEMBLY_ACC=CAM_ASM_000606 /TAXON_ID=109239 /ORGANISM="Alexandrium margalefi, Strain AMGDE01CS-322" /LENGTH=133 /DNA_ID=CAMNT_0051551125 /DNA_START=87 /DNA_END=488 /DNA_ORIENTATION=-